MASLIDTVRESMRGGDGPLPVCFACGRRIGPHQERLRVRGGTAVHRVCATYELRRRSGERLGRSNSR